MPASDRDGELLLRLATALWPFWSTRGYVAEGRQALEDALELAGRRPARALLGLCSLRVFSGNSDGLLDDVQEVLRAAEELGDPLTLAQAWNLLGRVEGTILGSLARAEEAWQQALEHAERGNLPTERAESIGWLMMAANFGPLPVEEGIARCRRFHDEAVDDPFIRGNACVELGALEAMRGDFPLGRELVAEGLETIAGLGFSLRAAMSSQEAFYVEMLAGDLDAAERIARDALTILERMGERSYLSSAAALLAHALSGLGELDEAERFSRTSEEAAAADDAFSQVLWRSARAKIRARRGELAEAEALAREAVALAERTDLLNTHGDTLADLGEVLALAGRPDEAVAVFDAGGGDLRAEGEPRLARAGPRRRAGARPVTYDVLVLGGGAAGCALAGAAEREPGPHRLPRRGRARTTGTSRKAAGRPTSSTRAGSRSSRTSGSGTTRTTARRRGRGSSAAARPTTPACCSRARPPTTSGAATGRTRRSLRTCAAPTRRSAGTCSPTRS